MTFLAAFILMLSFVVDASAQQQQQQQQQGGRANIKLVLQDSTNEEPVSYATISITKKNATTALKYALTDGEGKGSLDRIPAGTYTLKAEMMGYVTYTQEISLSGKDMDFGVIKLSPDQEVLDAANVTAVGNPIIVKKDTVEYSASSFKTTENDMLEDLLKKFPGVEVADDGSITANGQAITKIYVDGKTYFLDDPTLASKNLPAKIINKVKVVRKKSDQAEFTGIDDGEEETVLDLSIKQGMMNGIMGNLRAGIGHDLPVDDVGYNDYRYNGNLFLGNFSTGHQYSVIGNINNGNNMGFGGFGGRMMRGMGGGGGGGVTTSYMLGGNVGYDLFDDKMEASGNYSFNGADRESKSSTYSEQYFTDYSLISDEDNMSDSRSNSHNVSMRIEHNFSDNASIIFQPQISFGQGNSFSSRDFERWNGDMDGNRVSQQNDGFSINSSDSRSVSASGRLQYRQRLGIPGRTLVINTNFNLSTDNSDGMVQSLTNNYLNGADVPVPSIINQRTENVSKSSSVTARATYTEPIGNNFYVDANYSMTWSRSNSERFSWDSGLTEGFGRDNLVYNPVGEQINLAYSNVILNETFSQQVGADLLYQGEKLRAQLGISFLPSRIHNKTERSSSIIDTTYSRYNWSPQARIDYEVNDNLNARINYRGRTGQPSVSQLVPVLDNTNPISQSLGNPYLTTHFSHSIGTDLRYSNRQNFSSFNLSVDGGFNQNPIVNATWVEQGKTYSMPVNGPTTGNFSARFFANFPIAKSNFSISTNTGGGTSTSASYVGNNVGTDKYFIDNNGDGEIDDFDYLMFRNDYPDFNDSNAFERNNTRNLNFSESLTVTYRNDALEVRLGGSTRYSNSKYSINPERNINTWNNGLNGSFIWSWDLTGLSFRTDLNYRWYEGYTTERPSEAILNAEISKLIFKRQATLSLNAYDLLGQTRNFSVSDSGNSHVESRNNSLGRYIIVSFTWRFGTFGGGNRGGGNRGGGFSGGRPGGFGGGRPGGFGGR